NVLLALRWLRDHQAADGSWDPVRFAEAPLARAERTTGSYGNLVAPVADTGMAQHRAGLTGLAILAFLGAGCTPTEGQFQETVKAGRGWIRANQDNDGCFGDRNDETFVYGHAICAMAMAEAYTMTASRLLKGPAQRGADFIAMCQNEDTARPAPGAGGTG